MKRKIHAGMWIQPLTQEPDRDGRVHYEMHHVDAIGKVDDVHALNNIRIMTAKRHIEVDKGDK